MGNVTMVDPVDAEASHRQFGQKEIQMQINAIIEHDHDGFFAYVPALKGCVSQGGTVEDVLGNIKEAIELYLEDAGGDEKAMALDRSYLIAPIEIEDIHA